MHNSLQRYRLPAGAPTRNPVAGLWVDEYMCDLARVAVPSPEMHLVVRFGSSVPGGVDVHVLGARQTVRRKYIRGGQRTLFARLALGTSEAVLGASASELAGSTVALGALWGEPATQRLREQLAAAPAPAIAATILERAIIGRMAAPHRSDACVQLVQHASEQLEGGNVGVVAHALGVSERHLRRMFREVVGVSPKTFAKVKRFQRALFAAQQAQATSWSHVAADAGYYDQAHLIAEFKAIAGATPRALLAELREQAVALPRALNQPDEVPS